MESIYYQPVNRFPERTEKKFGNLKTEEFGEQSNWGRAGKPVDFVFNVPIHLW